MANEPRVTNGSPGFKAFRDNERSNDNANINRAKTPGNRVGRLVDDKRRALLDKQVATPDEGGVLPKTD